MRAFFQFGDVKRAKIDGLLDLAGEWPRQEHDGDKCMAHLHFRDWMRISGLDRKRLEQRFQIHFAPTPQRSGSSRIEPVILQPNYMRIWI